MVGSTPISVTASLAPFRTDVTFTDATERTPIHVLMEMALNEAPEGKMGRVAIYNSIKRYRNNFAENTVSYNLTTNRAFMKTSPPGQWMLSGHPNRQPKKSERSSLSQSSPMQALPYPMSSATSPSSSAASVSPSPPPVFTSSPEDPALQRGVVYRHSSMKSLDTRGASHPYQRQSISPSNVEHLPFILQSPPIAPSTMGSTMLGMAIPPPLSHDELAWLNDLVDHNQATGLASEIDFSVLLDALDQVPPNRTGPTFTPLPDTAYPLQYSDFNF